MDNTTFKPAGMTIAAIVAGLAAPVGAQALPQKPHEAAAEIHAAAAKFAPAEVLGAVQQEKQPGLFD